MKKRWVVLVVFLGSYIGLFGDLHLSKYLFKKYCNDGRTGLFIYEKVGLGEEYFIPFPDGKDPRFLPRDFVFDDGVMIDESNLKVDFQISDKNVTNKKLLSLAGPIYLHETTVVRISDGKVLSKAVSLSNELGWINRILSSAFPGKDYCPRNINEKGQVQPNYDHSDVVRRVFYRK